MQNGIRLWCSSEQMMPITESSRCEKIGVHARSNFPFAKNPAKASTKWNYWKFWKFHFPPLSTPRHWQENQMLFATHRREWYDVNCEQFPFSWFSIYFSHIEHWTHSVIDMWVIVNVLDLMLMYAWNCISKSIRCSPEIRKLQACWAAFPSCSHRRIILSRWCKDVDCFLIRPKVSIQPKLQDMSSRKSS